MILKHITPENAAGTPMEDVYGVFPPGVPVPTPMVLMSASPELAALQKQLIHYYITHEKLDTGFLGMLRLLVAKELDYDFCEQFNTGLLQIAGGMSEAEIEAMKNDPSTAPLEEEQKALLLFALKVVKNPEQITEKDVQKLRNLGWDDKDIFDASYHAAAMAGPSSMYKAFVK